MKFAPITLTTTNTLPMLLIYVVVFGVLIFFMMRPNKKEQKQRQEMMSRLKVGDSVLTRSGFYGVVIDISEEVVIVEFGSDRHCRIPMQKEAILTVESAEDELRRAAAEKNKDSDAGTGKKSWRDRRKAKEEAKSEALETANENSDGGNDDKPFEV
ncbi:MAG: preprotein translocase subunit YajC [Lachnospiraceae bacterium]|nr:preprotein translocase subunit YajC [Lachnospiraceae bacterium]